ncbi:hypothetical protein [Pseudomonas sp.]|uniref:hypothetical protein n=1 Tax=Pseudomonas sp. TaxID=306 RepID=UPI003A9730EB
MGLKTALYEVLSSDEASTVYGNYEGIETAHTKQGWIKDLKTQHVSHVSTVNLSMPLVPGSKIAIAFFNGEIIAFKRSAEIPIESPFKINSMAIELVRALLSALMLSIPFVGYVGGVALGGLHLINGENLLGNYKRMRGNRIYSAFVLLASLIAFAPPMYRNWNQLVSNYVLLALALLLVTVISQVIKVRAEQRIYARAVAGLNTCWRE